MLSTDRASNKTVCFPIWFDAVWNRTSNHSGLQGDVIPLIYGGAGLLIDVVISCKCITGYWGACHSALDFSIFELTIGFSQNTRFEYIRYSLFMNTRATLGSDSSLSSVFCFVYSSNFHCNIGLTLISRRLVGNFALLCEHFQAPICSNLIVGMVSVPWAFPSKFSLSRTGVYYSY